MRSRLGSRVLLVAALVSVLFASPVGSSQGSPSQGSAELSHASPESLGLSSERLQRLDAVMQQYVDEERVAGMVTLIARRRRIGHLKAYGSADRERGIPMRTDTIFRLSSMTKPFTVVSIMMLMEEGRLLVTDPVSKFIPAFEHTKVIAPPPAGSPPGTPYAVVPAKREITIHDLLTHTAGIGYTGGVAADLYKAANIFGWYHEDKNDPIGSVIERLATLPFQAQPGERFINGFSTDTLGYVVEKISGMSLDEFFRRRIFEPLRMRDSYFFLSSEKASRLAVVYSSNPEGGITRAPEGGMGQGDYVEGPRMAFAGGSGGLSTASDYVRFAQMLLNGGELDGVRLLSPKTVEMMTTNHVGKLYQNGQRGFGFNFELTLDLSGADSDLGRADRLGSPGDYGWYGAYFPRFWVDPSEQLVAIFLAQLTPFGDSRDLHDKFRSLVYQALVTSETSRVSSSDFGARTTAAR